MKDAHFRTHWWGPRPDGGSGHVFQIEVCVRGCSPTRLMQVYCEPSKEEKDVWEIKAGDAIRYKFRGPDTIMRHEVMSVCREMLSGALAELEKDLGRIG